jgi:hypothetical protein
MLTDFVGYAAAHVGGREKPRITKTSEQSPISKQLRRIIVDSEKRGLKLECHSIFILCSTYTSMRTRLKALRRLGRYRT